MLQHGKAGRCVANFRHWAVFDNGRLPATKANKVMVVRSLARDAVLRFVILKAGFLDKSFVFHRLQIAINGFKTKRRILAFKMVDQLACANVPIMFQEEIEYLFSLSSEAIPASTQLF